MPAILKPGDICTGGAVSPCSCHCCCSQLLTLYEGRLRTKFLVSRAAACQTSWRLYLIQPVGACPLLNHPHSQHGCSECLSKSWALPAIPMQLYNLNSQYGNEQELRELNRKLREAGIR